jgi:pyruvate formate lyase activating enzyme
MEIAGLQKVSLIDFPGRISCSIFLFGCNFLCGYCHNPSLVIRKPDRIYSKKEILDFLSSRTKYLDGVCITGGEPLLSIDTDFLSKIKSMGFAVKIDTNGCYPEKLKELIDAKLVDYVAMDIKASKENYAKVCGVPVDMAKIEQSIKLAASLPEYEFRTTVTNRYHTEEEMVKTAKWLNSVIGKKPKRFALQGFKNSGNFIDESFKTEPDTSHETLLAMKEKIKDCFLEVIIRD